MGVESSEVGEFYGITMQLKYQNFSVRLIFCCRIYLSDINKYVMRESFLSFLHEQILCLKPLTRIQGKIVHVAHAKPNI